MLLAAFFLLQNYIVAAYDKPSFTIQLQEEIYITQTIKASLACEAVRIVKISFICNNKNVKPSLQVLSTYMKNGEKYEKSEYVITRMHLENYSDPTNYKCHCEGWTSRGTTIKSKVAHIRIAYMRSTFQREPLSKNVSLGQQVELMCKPPYGAPRPEVFWIKNGHKIHLNANSNVHLGKSYNLLINEMSVEDSGIYYCVAKNIAGKRSSAKSKLAIKADGEWSDWDSWSLCSASCGEGTRYRSRVCRKRLFKDQLIDVGCLGQEIATEICTGPCIRSLENNEAIVSVNNCSKYGCHQPVSIPGYNDQFFNNYQTNNDYDYVLIISSLCAGAVFIIMFFLFITYLIYKRSKFHQAHPGSALFVSRNMILNKNECELYPHYLNTPISSTVPSLGTDNSHSIVHPRLPYAPLYIGSMTRDHTFGIDAMKNRENDLVSPDHYSSIQAEEDSQDMSLWESESKKGDSFSSSSDEVLDEAVGSQNTAGHQIYETAFDLLQHVDQKKCAFANVTHLGAKLSIHELGISLIVPEGAVPFGQTQYVFLAICNEDKERPQLPEVGTILTPIVICGPKSIQFRKPIVISLEHCCRAPQLNWTLSLLCDGYDNLGWKCLSLLGEEKSSPPVYCHCDEERLYIVTEKFVNKLCLVGKSSIGHIASKRMQILVLAPKNFRTDYTIRVYLIEDTYDAAQNVLSVEKKIGGILLERPTKLILEDNEHNICLKISEISGGWHSKLANNSQEIPFSHMWNSRQSMTHATFTLQQANDYMAMSNLQCVIEVSQKNGSAAIININTCSSQMKLEEIYVAHPQMLAEPLGCSLFPITTKQRIFQCFESKNISKNDWRLFANHLGFNNCASYYEEWDSPTSHLLELWELSTPKDKQIPTLLRILRTFGLIDLATSIELDIQNKHFI